MPTINRKSTTNAPAPRPAAPKPGEETVVYLLKKASEGGEAKSSVMSRLKEAGIWVKSDYSPYVGQYGILVKVSDEKAVEKLLHW